MNPVYNQLWEPAASSRLAGVPPSGREIPPLLGPPVRRWDLVPFRYEDRPVDVAQSSATEGMELVVPTWNNSGVHQPPPSPSASAVTTDSGRCMGRHRNSTRGSVSHKT